MSEMRRILSLPVDERDGKGLVDKWTERFRVPGGTWRLHPHQALALEYAAEHKGGLFPIDVGGGKTLLAHLLPAAMGIDPDDVLVLAPAELRDEAARERARYIEHFDVPQVRYISYAQLSRGDVLAKTRPRLIIADEADKLRNKSSARTQRFRRYMRKASPQPAFVAMSATLTNRSLHDYQHLSTMSLGAASPLPRSFTRLQAWARILDASPRVPPDKRDFARFQPLVDAMDASSPREAFARRFDTAPGVVRMLGSSCDVPIVLRRLHIDVPELLAGALASTRKTWLLPGDEEIDSPLDFASKLKQLAQGFYYYYDWPDGEPDRKWLYARNGLSAEIRRITRLGRAGLETRMLVEQAIERGDLGHDEALLDAWNKWQQQAHKPAPPHETCWITDAVVQAAVQRARQHEGPSLVWYSHGAVARALEAVPGVTVVWPGDGQVPVGDVVAVSRHSHMTGLNLQDFAYNLVMCAPANGGTWQQLIGRTHRAGQQADEVVVEWLGHTPELRGAVSNAKRDARYQVETQTIVHKLLAFPEKHCIVLSDGAG